MLKDKNFQIGFLVVQILAIILFACVAIPFGTFPVKFWAEMDELGIWLIQIFFLILTIIFAVVSVKLFMIQDNKFRYFHLILGVLVAVAFLVEASLCITMMSKVQDLPTPKPLPEVNDSTSAKPLPESSK